MAASHGTPEWRPAFGGIGKTHEGKDETFA